jgi:hypothetical protein
LGIGLAISGFVLGGVSWLLGMGLKLTGRIVLRLHDMKGFFNGIEETLSKAWQENKGIVAGLVGFFNMLAYSIGAVIYGLMYVVQLVFLFLGELGDKIFRKLGAPVARLFYDPPPRDPLQKIVTSEASEAEIYAASRIALNRMDFMVIYNRTKDIPNKDPHADIKNPRKYALDEAICHRARYLVEDATSFHRNPYDVEPVESSEPAPQAAKSQK